MRYTLLVVIFSILATACAAEPLSAEARKECLGDGALSVSIRESIPAGLAGHPIARFDDDGNTFTTTDGETLPLIDVVAKYANLSFDDPRQVIVWESPGMDAYDLEEAEWRRRYAAWAAENPQEFESRCRQVTE